MISAQKPINEARRVAALYEYDILDTIPEKEYDDITKIAADICGMPISLITLIDDERQWFKSAIGIDATETTRDVAFCAHALLKPEEIFIVPDSSKDKRFHDNPFVTGPPHVGFYAGVPLMNNDGYAVGTLCVLDSKPNELTREQTETLKALARQVVSMLEMRKMNKLLQAQKAEMAQLNEDLSQFAHVAAHDIKSPCASISMCATYLKENYADKIDGEGRVFLDLMEETSLSAIELINGILSHTQQVNSNAVEKELFLFGSLAEEVKELITIPEGFTFESKNNKLQLYTRRSIVLQVLVNLCNNAIKYNDKEEGLVSIDLMEEGAYYSFSVTDNGPGISTENQAKIFELFSTLGVNDRFNKAGTGIGLATVKRLAEKMGGKISVTSEIGVGSVFNFTIRK
jgi:signal transduction histidine kinase